MFLKLFLFSYVIALTPVNSAVLEETISSCRSDQWQCRDGTCISLDGKCDGVPNCPDGSDETHALCRKVPSPNGNCVLPPYPEHGSYVTNKPNAKPGEKYDYFLINVTCNEGYGVVGDSSVICLDGWSTTKTPECIRFCKLSKQSSVDYYCLLTGNVEGRRICNEYEPSNTQVIPECKKPNYYSSHDLRQMTCIDGSWSYVATCEAECGRVTPAGTPLLIGRETAKRGKIPWHAGIYTKTTSPYMQICGGSLISTRVIISAAHCLWSEEDGKVGALSENLFAVALGKVYRAWNHPDDLGAQKFDVKELKLPTKFRGNQANMQEDIALVTLSAEVVFQTYIRPVCLSFEPHFNERQLKDGNMGKVAGWGLRSEDGGASQILTVVELPYVNTDQCREQMPENYIEYITSAKICAGNNDGAGTYKGDSGGGLVFPAVEHTGITRYYIRGVVSTAPKVEVGSNATTLTLFTEIKKHEHFIRQGTSI